MAIFAVATLRLFTICIRQPPNFKLISISKPILLFGTLSSGAKNP